MPHLLNQLRQWFAYLPAKLNANRGWVGVTYISVLVVMALGVSQFEFGWGKNNPLQEDDPIRISMDHLKDQFGGNLVLPIVYRPTDGNLFSKQTLTAVKELHDELEDYRKSLRIQPTLNHHLAQIRSIIYTNYTEVAEDTLAFEPFVGKAIPHTPSKSEDYQRRALGHPDYVRTFVSEDGQMGAMWLRTRFGAIPKEQPVGTKTDEDVDFEEDAFELAPKEELNGAPNASRYKSHTIDEYVAFEREVLRALNNPKYTKALEFLPSSWGAVFRKDIFEAEMNLSMASSLAAGALVLLFLFRSFSAMLWTMTIMLSASMTTIGVAGWLGTIIDLELYIVVGLVNVAALADSVHVLSGFLYFRRQGQDTAEALYSVFDKTGLACLLTSITTAIGLASLYFIPITTIRSMGILGAVGVLIAFLYTICILPILLNFRSPKPTSSRTETTALSTGAESLHLIQRILTAIDQWTRTRPKLVVFLFGSLGFLFIAGANRVEVNTNMTEEYKETTTVRQATEILNKNFGGTGNLELLIDAKMQDAMTDPKLLNLMADTEQFMIKTFPHLGIKAYSIVNMVRESFKKLNENNPEYHRIPDSSNMISQIYLLISSGNPDEFSQTLNDDRSSARMSIRLRDPGSGVSVKMVERIQADLDRRISILRSDYPKLEVTVTGGVAFFSKLHEYISWSQIRSFGLAFLTISTLLVGIFGSFKVGLLAIIPNAFPALAIFGVMGWLDIPLGLTTLLVAPIVIGVAVDDTIHFLTHYTLGLKDGHSIEAALAQSIKEVGQAIVFTSVILVLTFLVFIPISHIGISRFGGLAVLAITAAMIADLVLLPGLCLLFKAK